MIYEKNKTQGSMLLQKIINDRVMGCSLMWSRVTVPILKDIFSYNSCMHLNRLLKMVIEKKNAVCTQLISMFSTQEWNRICFHKQRKSLSADNVSMMYITISTVRYCTLQRLGKVKVDSGVDNISEMYVQHGDLFLMQRLRKWMTECCRLSTVYYMVTVKMD